LILSKLNIFGFSKAQENAILASMLCGEPCLLIGPPGTAKTELVNAIGSALREDSRRENPTNPEKWFTYQVYDASKINFEDLFGYPDINGLKLDPPVVRYISTPSSIWGKELIAFDELNRCAEDRQSNLFEIIRSRKLHGTETGNLFIFSTMNPFGDQGTVEMSDALVDRHLFYLRLDRFSSMNSEDRRNIIKRVGQVDGLGFKYWGNIKADLDVDNNKINDKLADVGKELKTLFASAMKHYNSITESLSSSITIMIDKLVSAFSANFSRDGENVLKECSISGRRAAAMLRGIIAIRSIQYATIQPGEELEDIVTTLINTSKLCLPIGIGGKLNEEAVTRANILLEETIKSVWPQIRQGKDVTDIDKIQQSLTTSNPIKILDTLINCEMNDITKRTIFSALVEKHNNNYSSSRTVEDNYISVLLHKLDKEIPNFIPSNINLNIPVTLVEQVSEKTELNINILFKPYLPIITSMLSDKKNNPLLYYAMKTTLLYYKDKVKTDSEIIECLVSMKSLADSIETKIQEIKNGSLENQK